MTADDVLALDPPPMPDGTDALARRLSRAIQFETVSHGGDAPPCAAALLGLRGYLRQAFPLVHTHLDRETVADFSLLYRWDGTRDDLPALLLLAHLDVVPVAPDAATAWTHPPFAGEVAYGFVWGRGTMDDKVGVLGMLEAVELLLGQGFRPHRTVYLAFGHDEEVGGYRGAAQIADQLRQRGLVFQCALDEGLPVLDGLLPGVPVPVAMVGVAEKGYLDVELAISAVGGHSATPAAETAIGILAGALHRLQRQRFPGHLDGPADLLLGALAPYLPVPTRLARACSPLLDVPLVRALSRSPATNALVRTTLAPTVVRGGQKSNVLPDEAHAVVNLRLHPADTLADAIRHLRRVVADPRVELRPRADSACEPSALSSVRAPGYRAIERAVHAVLPDVPVAPGLLVTRTDSRHYADLAANVYRFRPQILRAYDLPRVHGVDERIAVADYARVVQFYACLLQGWDAQPFGPPPVRVP